MLVFTPDLCADPLAALEAALPHLDVVQVRVKNELHPEGASPAAELFTWCGRVLERVGDRALVLVNDRVDVARSLAGRGVAGVHVGDRDLPPHHVRALLGPDALVGLSTHSAADVVRAGDEDVDYLGFGPVNPTATKGYERGLGPEAAWVAHTAAGRPVFPIGGIDASNVGELEGVGRAAVGAGILSQPDPGAAAATLRALLTDADGG